MNQGIPGGNNTSIRGLDNAVGGGAAFENFAKTGNTSNFVEGAPLLSPGGVFGASLWLDAGQGVTQSNNKLQQWKDQTNVNTFTKTGDIDYFQNVINFNPTVNFSNTDAVASLPSNRLDGDTDISYVDGFGVWVRFPP